VGGGGGAVREETFREGFREIARPVPPNPPPGHPAEALVTMISSGGREKAGQE